MERNRRQASIRASTTLTPVVLLHVSELPQLDPACPSET